ncbi:hypothetical protein ACIBF1_08980 [Spirillospora sp. NPDC050679]
MSRDMGQASRSYTPQAAEPPGMTLMRLVHNGLSADLVRLVGSAERAAHDVTRSLSPIETGWEQLHRHLTTHLAVQATVLWPSLQDRIGGDQPGTDAHIVEALHRLAAERANLDPLIERVDAAVHYRHIDRLTVNARALSAAVDAHLSGQHHQVPLMVRHLNVRDWLTLGNETRRLLGNIGNATGYWRWLADVAEATGDPHAQSVVCDEMPPSIRLLLAAGGQRRYRRRYSMWRRA